MKQEGFNASPSEDFAKRNESLIEKLNLNAAHEYAR